MSFVTLEQARARGVALPSDDTVAQAIIDEEEAWLTRRIGPLEGARTETFYVGTGGTNAKLALRRPTSTVAVTDGTATLDADLVRLIDEGTAIQRLDSADGVPWYWVGPYVGAAYTPNDEAEVRKAVISLLTLALEPVSGLTSETLDQYSYTRAGVGSNTQAKALIVSDLLPTRDALYVVAVSRPVGYGDPVVNRAELPL